MDWKLKPKALWNLLLFYWLLFLGQIKYFKLLSILVYSETTGWFMSTKNLKVISNVYFHVFQVFGFNKITREGC